MNSCSLRNICYGSVLHCRNAPVNKTGVGGERMYSAREKETTNLCQSSLWGWRWRCNGKSVVGQKGGVYAMQGLRLQFYKGRDHVIKPETCDSLIFKYFRFAFYQSLHLLFIKGTRSAKSPCSLNTGVACLARLRAGSLFLPLMWSLCSLTVSCVS